MGSEKNMDGVDELFAAFKISSASLVDELREIKEDYT